MNSFAFLKITKTARDKTAEQVTITGNPHGVCVKGIAAIFTFIPKALKTIVGIAITTVIIARTFMTMLRLLEITEAKASIIPLKIPL